MDGGLETVHFRVREKDKTELIYYYYFTVICASIRKDTIFLYNTYFLDI